MDSDFVNLYIEKLLEEINSLYKEKVFLKTQVGILEKNLSGATLKNLELVEALEKSKKKKLPE